jgi:hypothetical protein
VEGPARSAGQRIFRRAVNGRPRARKQGGSAEEETLKEIEAERKTMARPLERIDLLR